MLSHPCNPQFWNLYSAYEPIQSKFVSLQSQKVHIFPDHLHCVQMLPHFVGPWSPAALQYKCTLTHEFLFALASKSVNAVNCSWSCVACLLQVFSVLPAVNVFELKGSSWKSLIATVDQLHAHVQTEVTSGIFPFAREALSPCWLIFWWASLLVRFIDNSVE